MIIIFESNLRFFHETFLLSTYCGTHSTHNTCMLSYTVIRWNVNNWSGRRASNFQSTLPRAHYPLYRTTKRIVCSLRFSELVSSTDMKTKTGLRVTITTGINIKIVFKLCNVGSMVKRDGSLWRG